MVLLDLPLPPEGLELLAKRTPKYWGSACAPVTHSSSCTGPANAWHAQLFWFHDMQPVAISALSTDKGFIHPQADPTLRLVSQGAEHANCLKLLVLAPL